MEKFFYIVHIKFEDTSSVSLITDTWTNEYHVDFIALGASLTNEYFEKEILIINMVRMPGA